MHAMWTIYGLVPDPDDPSRPNFNQVPLLREWNEQHWIGSYAPLQIMDVPATARAFREAVFEMGRSGSNLAESPAHGEALAAFLERANASGQMVRIEEWLG